MENIHVAFICSDEYVFHTSVTAISILENLSYQAICHFHVISLDLKEKTKKRLLNFFHKSRSTVHFPYLDPQLLEIFKEIGRPERVPIITYARILLPTILPDLDKVIYMDSDVLVRHDLLELWNTGLGSNYFAMVDDVNKLSLSNKLWKYPSPYYFNAGVMIVNAKLLRENNYRKLLRNKICKNGKLYSICDQDVINDVFCNRILSLSPEWNMYAPWYGGHPKYEPLDAEGYIQGEKDPKIVHGLGIYRPWFPSVKHPYKSEFIKYARKSPFYKFFNTYVYAYDNTKFYYMTVYDHPFFSTTRSSALFRIGILGFPLFKRKKKPTGETIRVLGLKIFQKDVSRVVHVKRILYGLFKSKKKETSITYYTFGIPIYRRRIQREYESVICNILSQQRIILDKLTRLQVRIPLVASQVKQALSIAKLHSEVFPPFKRINTGRDVVIVAPGPTCEYYEPLKGAVHIGMNSSPLNKNIDFDYIFVQDYNIKSYIEDFADLPAVKFYGLFHERPLVKPVIERINIPQCVADRARALRYYTGYPITEFHYDIETFPLADYDSVVFPALQFALYTNPRRIFLVGCDCAQTGHFQSTDKIDLSKSYLNISKILRGYNALKEFAEVYYPEIEFISVNPVGLVGMFRDVYTPLYLSSHAEVMGVDILK